MKKKETRRTRWLQVRLDEVEFAKYKLAAAKAGKKVSVWARETLGKAAR